MAHLSGTDRSQLLLLPEAVDDYVDPNNPVRFKAVNNKDRNFTRGALSKFIGEADEKLADYMKRLDESDADENEVGGGIGPGGRGGDLTEKMDKFSNHQALADAVKQMGASIRGILRYDANCTKLQANNGNPAES